MMNFGLTHEYIRNRPVHRFVGTKPWASVKRKITSRGGDVKISEFKRYLESHGVTVKEGGIIGSGTTKGNNPHFPGTPAKN